MQPRSKAFFDRSRSNNGVTSNVEDEKNVLSETLNDIVLD